MTTHQNVRVGHYDVPILVDRALAFIALFHVGSANVAVGGCDLLLVVLLFLLLLFFGLVARSRPVLVSFVIAVIAAVATGARIFIFAVLIAVALRGQLLLLRRRSSNAFTQRQCGKRRGRRRPRRPELGRFPHHGRGDEVPLLGRLLLGRGRLE